MRYLSCDIETTGLDPGVDRILEVAFVLEDTNHYIPLEELDYLHLYIVSDSNRYNVTPFTAKLHRRLWEKLEEFEILMGYEQLKMQCYKKPVAHYDCTLAWCIPHLLKDWLERLGIGDWKIVFAGKNFGNFDWQFLKRAYGWRDIRMSHRFLDLAILYITPGDIVPPDLPTCLNRCGEELSDQHTALGDALDVIKAIRHKVK